MPTHSRVNLVRSWLMVDRSDRLVYLTGTRYAGLYLAGALVLAFLALMAYPAAQRHPTASDTGTMAMVDRLQADRGLRGIPLPVSPARLRERAGVSPRLRPLHRALSGLLALGALMAAVGPLLHRVSIRVFAEAGLLRVRGHSPLRTRTFEVPLSASIRLDLRSVWPHREREIAPSDGCEPIRWALELMPSTALPPMDIHVEPTGDAGSQPPHRAKHLAERLAEMTGWTVGESDAGGSA